MGNRLIAGFLISGVLGEGVVQAHVSCHRNDPCFSGVVAPEPDECLKNAPEAKRRLISSSPANSTTRFPPSSSSEEEDAESLVVRAGIFGFSYGDDDLNGDC